MPQRPISNVKTFTSWPVGYATRSIWSYEQNRSLKRGEKPSFVTTESGNIPVYHISQTNVRTRRRSDFETAKLEFMRRFWFHSRHDAYLRVSAERHCFIDLEKQRERGVKAPWLSEQMVLEHLQGKSTYGICAEQFARKASRTYWLAIDLDLHLSSGGNLGIFQKQLRVLLEHFWGKLHSQLVVAPTKANGVHLYIFFGEPMPLNRAHKWLGEKLRQLHAQNPDLATDVNCWNNSLRRTFSRKNWKVRQLDELEVYPVTNKGFRFLGVAGKVVLSDRVIGTASWGRYVRGKQKGQEKHGFNVLSWWASLNTENRMPLEQVVEYVTARLPHQSEQVVVKIDSDVGSAHGTCDEAPRASSNVGNLLHVNTVGNRVTSNSLHVNAVTPISYRGNTREILMSFWLGADNPPKSLDQTVLITARLLAAEGLTQAEALEVIRQYVNELPSVARQCSSRLLAGNEQRLDRDVIKQVHNAFTKPARKDPETARRKLAETILAWKRGGFRLSDKNSWHLAGRTQSEAPIFRWTVSDLRAFKSVLLPALKTKDLTLATDVATEIVNLTFSKQEQNQGWGYGYLKIWLPDKFGIPCAKPKKQQDVLIALRRLKLIQEYAEPLPKVKATVWHLGQRAWARLDGDMDSEFAVTDPQSELSIQKSKEGLQLLGKLQNTLTRRQARNEADIKKEG